MVNALSARPIALSAAQCIPERYARAFAAFILARGGRNGEAEGIVANPSRQFPADTVLNSYWLPSIRATVELNRHHPANAVTYLQSAANAELGSPQPFVETAALFVPVYLRGQAYLLLRQGREAAAEFEKFVHFGNISLNGPLAVLAHLELGRAYAMQRDTVKAKTAYDDFFTLWKDADPDIPS